jgi:hypothetical protein
MKRTTMKGAARTIPLPTAKTNGRAATEAKETAGAPEQGPLVPHWAVTAAQRALGVVVERILEEADGEWRGRVVVTLPFVCGRAILDLGDPAAEPVHFSAGPVLCADNEVNLVRTAAR